MRWSTLSCFSHGPGSGRRSTSKFLLFPAAAILSVSRLLRRHSGQYHAASIVHVLLKLMYIVREIRCL